MRRLVPSVLPLLLAAACAGETVDDAGLPADTGADAGITTDTGVDSGTPADSGADAGIEDAGDMDSGTTDGGFTPPEYGRWVKFEPPGAVCSNGSQYKFFVNFSRTSENVVIFMEGGGACWDYASCTGTGIRSAANPNGIRDNHASALTNMGGINIPADAVYPLLNASPDVSPMAEWNKVFIPYCTGDVYSGDRVVTYSDPAGVEPDVEFHHVGHRNILRTVEMLNTMFTSIPKMFLGGCSAGGAGAVINYHTFRSGLNVEKGYLLDDSGPIYPDQAEVAWSLPLHERVRASWNVDPLIEAAPMSQDILQDFGALNRVLAQTYPNDRLALTQFRLDYNYSLYSYERFYEVDGETGDIVPFGDGMGLGGLGLDEAVADDRAAVYQMWWDDTSLMRSEYDTYPNLAYFMPFYRDTNSSHCLTIPGFGEFPQDELLNLFINDFATLAWAGTNVGTSTASMNIRGFVDHLLDDGAPLMSAFEETPEGPYQSCTPDFYDAAACAAAN
ncbi:MAG: hypothetical protein KC933_19560 [Myxococcales bacterium]|nr:hypothetical protein [Myxococcales bacterium]